MSFTLKKFGRNLRDYGFAIAIKKGVYYLTGPVYEKRVYRIYTIDLSSFAERKFNESQFAFTLISEHDTEVITRIEHLEEWLTGQVAAKLRKGGLCLVAMDRDRVAGFNLVAFDYVYIPLIAMNKRLRRDEAWSEQITVNPDYRGKGLAEVLRYRVFSELKRRDIRQFSGGTLTNNVANLKLTRKVGFTELVDVHYSKLLGVKTRRYVRVR